MDKIEDILDKEGFYVSTSSGYSMLPFLRDRTDTIIIRKKDKYKKYDVVLYKRNNQYILHRIVRCNDNYYIIRGDNCYYNEDDISYNDVIGCLDECYRGEKYINLNSFFYKLYCIIWVKSYPIRYMYKALKNKIRSIMK